MQFSQPYAYNTVAEHVAPFNRPYLAQIDDSGVRPTSSSAVDPAIAAPGVMSPSLQAQYRRDSMTNSLGVLSPPADVKWDTKPEVHGLGIHLPSFPQSGPFHARNDNFAHVSSTSGSSAMPSSWGYEQTSEDCTPTSFDLYAPEEFDAARYPSTSNDQSHSGYPSFTPIQQEPGFLPGTRTQAPLSPHSNTDWMNLAAQEQQGRHISRRVRPNGARAVTQFMRPDGIRKKNTRIEIPQERSLDTIERLIEISQDDDEVKELKAQRRLLRNRDAAYVQPE